MQLKVLSNSLFNLDQTVLFHLQITWIFHNQGIGQKRAEYILELREEMPNPLKSVSHK